MLSIVKFDDTAIGGDMPSINTLRSDLVRTWHPADVDRGTHGLCNPVTQRSWVARRLVPCPFMVEPRASKPREFPGLAVIEMAILAECAATGLPLQLVSDCLKVLYVQLSGDYNSPDRLADRENNDRLARRYVEEAKSQRESRFADILAFRYGAVREGTAEGFNPSPLLDQLSDYFSTSLIGKTSLGLYRPIHKETKAGRGMMFAAFVGENGLSLSDPDWSGNYEVGPVSTSVDLAMIIGELEKTIEGFLSYGKHSAD